MNNPSPLLFIVFLIACVFLIPQANGGKRTSVSKTVFCIVLALLGWWVLVPGTMNYNLGIWYGVLHGELQRAQWAGSALKYTIPTIVIGVFLLWGATKMWVGWRLGMGLVALFSGLSAALSALQVVTNGRLASDERYIQVASVALVCEAVLSVGAGAVLLALHRSRRKKAPALAANA